MGSYAYELQKSTSFINRKHFDDVLENIKKEVKKDNWDGFGWRNDVLSAETLEDVAKTFNIKLVDEDEGYYRPVIYEVYISHFFRKLLHIVAPYMTDGKIVVRAEYKRVIITFANKDVSIEWE